MILDNRDRGEFEVMNIIKKIIGYVAFIIKNLWYFLSYIPTFFIRILTLIILIVLVGSIFSKLDNKIQKDTALYIPLNGVLVEQMEEMSSIEYFVSGNKKNEIELGHIVRIIKKATEDEKISTIVIDLSNFFGGYPADIFYLCETLGNFKKRKNKKIIAIADQYSQASYLIASLANQIILHPSGGVVLTGWSSKRVFIKDFLDKLDVKVLPFSKGEYKSAFETYTRSSMSVESKESNSKLFQSIWSFTSEYIENNRSLKLGKIDNYIQNIDTLVDERKNDFAELALNFGLVDNLMTRVEVENFLSENFPIDGSDWRFIHYKDYKIQKLKKNKNIIGVIPVAGVILDGSQPRGFAGGENISSMIREARKEKNLKALILRVNTPGGSAFASEIIREQLMAIKERNIPIVVSMGGLAASGGYWISAESDYIFAHETSVTGSIGVAAILFDGEDTIKQIGLNEDGVSNSPFSSVIDSGILLSSPSDRAVNLIQGSVDKLYNDFIKIVAKGRGISLNEANSIAKGRVWSGRDALDLGLVDEIGSFDDAILKAKSMADINDYYIKEYGEIKNNISILMNLLNFLSLKESFNSDKSFLQSMKNELLNTLKWTKNLNDRNNLYLICDECISNK